MGLVYVKKDIDAARSDLVRFIREGLSSAKDLHMRDGKVESQVQYFFSRRPSGPLVSKLYDIVLAHAVQSEASGPGSFTECLRLVVEGLVVGGTAFRQKVLDRATAATSQARFAQESDVGDLVDSHCYSPTLTAALRRALETAGFRGRIAIERTDADVLSVERTAGYSFEAAV